MRVVTTELTSIDMKNKIKGERSWADAPILAHNDEDREAINYVRAKSFAGISNQLVFMRLKQTSTKNIP